MVLTALVHGSALAAGVPAPAAGHRPGRGTGPGVGTACVPHPPFADGRCCIRLNRPALQAAIVLPALAVRHPATADSWPPSAQTFLPSPSNSHRLYVPAFPVSTRVAPAHVAAHPVPSGGRAHDDRRSVPAGGNRFAA